MLKVIIASHGSAKIAAVKKGFDVYQIGVDILAVNAPSGISDRPLGHDTLKGCQNRLNAAKSAVIDIWPDADYIISIESGFFIDAAIGSHMKTAVLVKDRAGGEQMTWSVTTPISLAMYNWAKAGKSFRQLFGERPIKKIDPIDVFYLDFETKKKEFSKLEEIDQGANYSLTQGGLNRVDTIAQAVVAALAPLLMAENYRHIDQRAE